MGEKILKSAEEKAGQPSLDTETQQMDGNPDTLKEDETLKTSNQSEGDVSERNISEGDEDLSMLKKKKDEYYQAMMRVAADFENYKRRAAKDRESMYQDAQAEVVISLLPIVDNFERALKAQEQAETEEAFRSGVEMVYKQLKESLHKLGVKEIEALGQSFDPELHNAVMHVEDENFGENEIIEEFLKGYRLGDKVIRHSMVKVAN